MGGRGLPNHTESVPVFWGTEREKRNVGDSNIRLQQPTHLIDDEKTLFGAKANKKMSPTDIQKWPMFETPYTWLHANKGWEQGINNSRGRKVGYIPGKTVDSNKNYQPFLELMDLSFIV